MLWSVVGDDVFDDIEELIVVECPFRASSFLPRAENDLRRGLSNQLGPTGKGLREVLLSDVFHPRGDNPRLDVEEPPVRDLAFGSLLKRKKTTERGLAHNGFRALPGWWTEARLKPNDLTYANITWYSLAAVPDRPNADHRRSLPIIDDPGHTTGS